MLEFLNSGGIFMYFILATSIIAFAIIVERFISLQYSYQPKEKFFKSLIGYLKRNDFASAQLLCHGTNHPLAQVVSVIFKNKNSDFAAIESAVDIAVQKLIPKIQKRTSYLAMIGNVATLLGLLGTIRGLIISFQSLSSATAETKAELLASGISTAMNTTAFGLMVAIPCIVTFTLLSNKENNILEQYSATLSQVLHLIKFGNLPSSKPNNEANLELKKKK